LPRPPPPGPRRRGRPRRLPRGRGGDRVMADGGWVIGTPSAIRNPPSSMYQSVRGTFDVLPVAQGSGDDGAIPGSAQWREAERVVRGVMARFGFEEIRTPVLEPLGLIARGVGATTDIVQREMFVVAREDEDYVLRP